ncbi:MAG: hypothetical protein ACOX5G_00100 [Kiritimatiellia bacterium]
MSPHPEPPDVPPLASLLPVWRRIQQAMAQRLSSHGVPLSLGGGTALSECA